MICGFDSAEYIALSGKGKAGIRVLIKTLETKAEE